VLADSLFGAVPLEFRPWLLPVAAFAGALAATALVFAIARRGGATHAGTLILTGVAVNAIGFAAVGLLTYMSDDQQLRDLTFWSMGGLDGARWRAAALAAVASFSRASASGASPVASTSSSSASAPPGTPGSRSSA
jgi:iron complex transport system permease protein